jgi:DNA-directed RNA polymerase specialized sigma24 family protein
MALGKDCASRAREPFEKQWPDLVRGLDRALRNRHVPAGRREDIIQETGLRLFVRWAELDPDRPVWPFALTIALNLLKDEQRMQARRNASQPLDENVERGVEEEALARLELLDVRLALHKLTPAQRSVLLADLGELPYDDRAPAALKMLRMRARRSLRNAIDRASALVWLAGARVRDACNSAGVALQRNAGAEQGQLVVLSALGIAGAATILGASFGVGGAVGWSRSSTDAAAPRALANEARATHVSLGSSRVAAREGPLTEHRALRGGTMAQDGHVPRARRGEVATIAAGGTGVDEEPSLHSDSYRVSLFARAVVSGQETFVDYEVEQANPICGSRTATIGASRSCVRARAPTARGRGRVAGRALPKIGPR